MKRIQLQFLAAIIIFSVIGILGLDYYQNSFPQKSISEYYAILDNQENIFPDEKITKEQIRDLEFCSDDLKCFAEYYENYNASTTLEASLSNVALLLKENPKYNDYCHFIFHGIGHSELEKNNGDVFKTLDDFNNSGEGTGTMYKNLSTCGNGYIHGVLEQGVKEIKDKDELVDFFNKMCETEEVKKAGQSDCYHGLGHASSIQLDLNVDDALYVCKNVSKSVYEDFNCYTGVFMEATISMSQQQIIKKVGNNFEFPICDTVQNELERQACFFEGVIKFRDFVEKGTDNKVHFSDLTPMCKIFNDDYYRMLCIRNISIRAITENRETNLEKMCIENISSRAERIMCVLGFAHRLALSIDSSRGVKYTEIYKDICKVLKQDEAIVCEKIIKDTPGKAYYFTEKDINTLNF